jgi:hypothetical protein
VLPALSVPEDSIRSVSASSNPLAYLSSSSWWTPGRAPTCTPE